MENLSKDGDAAGREYYKRFKIEPIDFIVANELDFIEGNVIKYICRYKYKNMDTLEDLRKAKQNVEWLIEREEKKTAVTEKKKFIR